MLLRYIVQYAIFIYFTNVTTTAFATVSSYNNTTGVLVLTTSITLVAGLIEARSCERFKVLSENLEDPELREFYRVLMVSEANHYTMFLRFARKYAGKYNVNQKWQDLLTYEAEVMKDLGNKELIHG